MEGADEFARRFVVELDPADYPNALVHTDQIKAAIMRHNETVPVKPEGSARKVEPKAQLAISLLALGDITFTGTVAEGRSD
jgi:hypothetical protein